MFLLFFWSWWATPSSLKPGGPAISAGRPWYWGGALDGRLKGALAFFQASARPSRVPKPSQGLCQGLPGPPQGLPELPKTYQVSFPQKSERSGLKRLGKGLEAALSTSSTKWTHCCSLPRYHEFALLFPHGYPVHTAMIRFSWATTSVDDKIQALPKKKDRRRATKALRHLLTCTDSAYKTFYDLHLDFLRKHGTSVQEKLRKLPLSFLETPGLECAVWPELCWHRNLCETVARANHENRRKRRRAARQQQTGDSTSSSDGDKPERAESRIACSRLGRIKRGFLRKVLSPVIGYGLDYTLLHFVYDLSMWTTVGTKKNIARQHDAPLRLILSSCPWTPQYWRIRHQAVIDMQRQCGNAALFRTRAPYERSFPYHQWVLHEHRAAGRARQHLAGAETLHQAHALLELDRALFAGARCCADRKDRKWTKHLLAAATSPENTPTVLARVTRLEFQDGRRKQAKMSYHGRGTTHSHSLDFLENKASIQLETKISASVPDRDREPLLHGLVLDGQRDYKSSGLRTCSSLPFGMKTPTQSSYTIPWRTKNSVFGHIFPPLWPSQSVTRMSSREMAMGLSCATSQRTSRSSATAWTKTG